jgi:hypothetical protein
MGHPQLCFALFIYLFLCCTKFRTKLIWWFHVAKLCLRFIFRVLTFHSI